MFALVVIWILALGLGVLLVMTGLSRYFDAHVMVARRSHLKISRTAFRALGVVETVTGACLVLGAAAHNPPWIGLGAALVGLATTGVFLTLHLQAGDEVGDLLPAFAPVFPFAVYIVALLSI